MHYHAFTTGQQHNACTTTAKDYYMEVQNQDPWLRNMITWLTQQTFDPEANVTVQRQIRQQADNYSCKNGTLYYTPGGQSKRLIIPPKYMNDLIAEFHDSPFGGHFGMQKTLSRITKFYWWRGITQQVNAYCTNCLSCQMQKSGPTTSKQPLTPWTLTTLPMM